MALGAQRAATDHGALVRREGAGTIKGRDEIDEGFRGFLAHWFAGLMQGLDEVDESSRRKVLHRCGVACAASYTAGVFCDAKRDSIDMASFLSGLESRFAGAHYCQDGPRAIKVRYDRCGCDLVRLGLVRSPSFCECTVANLRANFERSLGVSVRVALENSILRGSEHCDLTVTLE